MRYDLVVIGGGPAGYTAAIRAAKLGKRVALVEERELGGTCLNRGCIPTKALLHSGEAFFARTEWAELGIVVSDVSFDERKAFERKDKIVENLKVGIQTLIKANKIDLYKARGIIENKNTVAIHENTNCGDHENKNCGDCSSYKNSNCGDCSPAGEPTGRLETDFILIATGSNPASVVFDGGEISSSGGDSSRGDSSGGDLSSDDIPSSCGGLSSCDLPLNSDNCLAFPIEGERVVIVGAGVIAVELATYYSGIGRAVTLVARGERIIRSMSRDMSMQLASSLKKRGVKIITGAEITRATRTEVTYRTSKGEEVLTADNVVVAVGRSANIRGIGLENVGITAWKFIEVDENMKTSVDSIYACGDVTGGIMLAHLAAAEAITAVESMFSLRHSFDLNVVPSCIYTTPEIAAVGKREDEVEGAKIGKFLMAANGKSAIEGINRGFIKVVADSLGTIVGAEIFSSRATDIVGELALAISNGLKIDDLTKTIHAHPTIYEAIAEAAEDIEGMATHLMPKK